MKSDYDYYLMGCRDRGVKPLSAWRFGTAYAKYLRLRQKMAAAQTGGRNKRARLHGPLMGLRDVALLVRRGQDVFDRARRSGEDEDGHAGAGTREPRSPLQPVLAGCAASALPDSRDDDMAFWRI